MSVSGVGEQNVTAVPSRPTSARAKARGWSWAHYLAVIGALIFVLEAWTVIAWLADGPYQVTKFRTPYSANWWGAVAYEVIGVVLFVVMALYVIRGCIRERRFTFDAMFMTCGITLFWQDLFVNAFGPTFFFSSNFINLNNPMGHMPGMVNPDVGRAPDPILFSIPLDSAGILAGAMLMCFIMRRLKARYPDISTAQLVVRLLAIALVLDIIVETPVVALGLWNYTAPGWMSLPLGQGLRFPVAEWISGMCVFGFYGLMRAFKDDRGRTLVERGLEHLSPARATAITFFALYGFVQLVALGPADFIDIAYAPYETPWPKIPQYLVNDTCDAPGVHGTRFGPCPGSPGYRMPGRGSLPGHNP